MALHDVVAPARGGLYDAAADDSSVAAVARDFADATVVHEATGDKNAR